MDEASRGAADPHETDVDENGVDLAQIRAMLDLPPAQRLERATAFLTELLEIRNRNAGSGSP